MPKNAEALVIEATEAVSAMQEDHKTLSAMVKEMSKEIHDDKEAVAKIDEQLAKVDARLLEDAGKIAGNVTSLADQINEIEQKIAENVMAGTTPVKTIGQLLIETDECKAFMSGNLAKMSVSLDGVFANTITGQDGGSPARNSNVLVEPDRLGRIIPGAFRALRIKDVLPQGNTTSNSVEYTRERTFTNNAAETEEGITKPQTDIIFELVNAPVKTIAHFLKLSRQVREDSAQLASYVDTRLRFGVDQRIDTQLLVGDGAGQNISGLETGDNYQGFSPTVGETELDTINRMKYAVSDNEYNASVVIMHPQDWGNIERLKDQNDNYVVGNPLNPFGPILWGVPVVLSNAQVLGKVYVAAIEIVAQVWNRSGTVVEMFEQDESNVQQNLLTVRAENRLALAIYRPASAVFGALVAPGASA